MKPKCKLSGTDGNVFSVISKVTRSLRDAGMVNQAIEFKDKAFVAPSYDAILQLCHEYVDVR